MGLKYLKFRELESAPREGSSGFVAESRSETILSGTKYDSLNDRQLWSGFVKGDEGAFIKIYNSYFKELYDFGIQYATASIVEDAIQDLFIDLRRKRKDLPELKRSIRLFLFQCLKRRLLNMLKKEKNNYNGDVPEHKFEISLPQESLIILNQEQKEKLERLDKALANLNEKQREIVYFYFYKGLSYEDIQDLMGFHNVKSVRNLVYKIIKTLKKSFLFFF